MPHGHALPSVLHRGSSSAISLLTLIDNCRRLQELRQIHAKCIIAGLSYGQFILTKLISFFVYNEHLDYATQIFSHIHEPDTYSWNSMIRIYTSFGAPFLAISMYNNMRIGDQAQVDKYTFPFIFRACANLSAIGKGQEIHGTTIRLGYEFDKFIQSSLLNFYDVCRETDYARQVFDEFERKDLVFWNAMIMSYARAGRILGAFETFHEMLELKEMRPNEGTMLGLISVCLIYKNIELGCTVHGYTMKTIDFRFRVKLGAALIDFYAKSGLVIEARVVFEEMMERNTVVWNTLISCYSQNDCPCEAVDLFREMLVSDVRPDQFTISGILSACAQLGAINFGNWVWKFAKSTRIWDVFVGTALIDMYAKCGEITLARDIFYKMQNKSVATWNAVLSGFASHGQAQCALDLFHEMERSGFIPDSISFLAILNACAHAGLVKEGRHYFNLMKCYKIVPKIEHYGCMVDILGRAGYLSEAKELIENMEIEPNVTVWGSLLSACTLYGDAEMGEWAAYHTLKLDPLDGGSYVLLSNVYASAQRYDKVRKVREMMAQKGVQKPPGCSMIEVGNVVHEFIVADESHPRSDEIYSLLDELYWRMKTEGYVPLPALCNES